MIPSRGHAGKSKQIWLRHYKWQCKLINGGFHKWRCPNSWMVYNRKSHSNGWFGGTRISGNLQIFIRKFHQRNITFQATQKIPNQKSEMYQSWDFMGHESSYNQPSGSSSFMDVNNKESVVNPEWPGVCFGWVVLGMSFFGKPCQSMLKLLCTAMFTFATQLLDNDSIQLWIIIGLQLSQPGQQYMIWYTVHEKSHLAMGQDFVALLFTQKYQ